jgi:hypothetical protein
LFPSSRFDGAGAAAEAKLRGSAFRSWSFGTRCAIVARHSNQPFDGGPIVGVCRGPHFSQTRRQPAVAAHGPRRLEAFQLGRLRLDVD